MKVLLINDYGGLAGGGELQALLLRERLRARGHDARLFTSSARRQKSRQHADYSCFGTTSPLKTWLQAFNPWAYYKLKQVLAEFNPDIVHVSMFLSQLSPLILPLLKDRVSLHHILWYRPICPTGTKVLPGGTPCHVEAGSVCLRGGCVSAWAWPAIRLQLHLMKKWGDVFDSVIASSHSLRRRLSQEGIRPVDVIYSSVATRPPRESMGKRPIAIYVGRLIRQKGVDLLIRAFARIARQVPDARLAIAGNGPELNQLHALASALRISDQIEWHTDFTRADLEELYARAWVQVLPSRWREPFNTVTLEAMMRGIAPIVSEDGGLSEIVQPGVTGLPVPPGNETHLANAMLQLLGNQELAAKMGRAARSDALRLYSDLTMVDKFILEYKRLLHARGRRV